MKPISAMTQAELAAFVQSHLRKNKIYVTLSGGAAVSIYTVNRYVSADIDLVEDTYADRNKVNNAMEEIGFREKNRYFTHPETQHIIEFPSGPLSVGGEAVKNITEIKYATGILRVISPTDCVKDRLAAYYFWKDQQSFNQALLVAQNNPVTSAKLRNCRKQKDILKNLKNS